MGLARALRVRPARGPSRPLYSVANIRDDGVLGGQTQYGADSGIADAAARGSGAGARCIYRVEQLLLLAPLHSNLRNKDAAPPSLDRLLCHAGRRHRPGGLLADRRALVR